MKSSSKPGMLIIVSPTMKLLCCGSPNAKCAFDLPLLSLFLLELKLQQFFPEKLCRKCLSEKSKVEEENWRSEERRRKEEEKRDGGPISRYGGRTYGKLCGAHGESDEDDGRKVVAQALGGPENHKGEQEKLQTEVATHAGKPGKWGRILSRERSKRRAPSPM